MVWVDDLIIWGKTHGELADNLEFVLEQPERRAIYVAAHKCRFFEPSIRWCGRIYSGEGVTHDPQRIQGLIEMRRPEMVSELMQFRQAANWMRTHSPQFATAEEPLQALTDDRLAGTRRTRQVATGRPLTEQD